MAIYICISPPGTWCEDADDVESHAYTSKAHGAMIAASAKLANDLGLGWEVRKLYLSVARVYSDILKADVKAGILNADAAAAEMMHMRGVILDAARARLDPKAPLSLRISQWMKEGNRTAESLLEKYALELHKKPWKVLNAAEAESVVLEIVSAGGRGNRWATVGSAAAAGVSRALTVLSVGLAIHEIMQSDDKLDTAGRLASQWVMALSYAALAAEIASGPYGWLVILLITALGSLTGDSLYRTLKYMTTQSPEAW